MRSHLAAPGVAAADELSLRELERRAAAARDPSAAARLYLELGRALEERLRRPDRAVLMHARASRLDPALEEARVAALRCQLGLRRFGWAKRTLDGARSAGSDPQQLAAAYARLGALLVAEPLDHALASEALAAARALDPALPGPAAALEELERARAGWRAEAQALLDGAARAKERRAAAERVLRAAALHAAHAPDDASRFHELVGRALLLAPGNARALELLERYHRAHNDATGLSGALRRLAESVRDRAARAAIHLRLGESDLAAFGDAALASESFGRALELDPASGPAAVHLLELHLDAGRKAEALAVLEAHLGAAPERPEHVAHRLLAAELALAAGDDGRARVHLEAASRLDAGEPAVARALAPVLERAGEWRRLADALAVAAAAEPEGLARARALERLAAVELERLASPRPALEHLAEALRLDPGSAAVQGALDGAAAQADLYPELARAYRAAADAPSAGPAARKLLLRRAAEVWDRDLGRPDQAVEAWRELVSADPADAGARAALEGCRIRAGELHEVAAELRARLADAPEPQRRELLAKLARVYAGAGDALRAAAAWREVVSAGEDVPSLRALADALAQTADGGAAERAEVLASLAGKLSGVERATVEVERALLLREPLGRRGEAAAILLGAVQGGELPPPSLGQATAALEELLAGGTEPVRIAQALAPAFAAAGDHAKSVAMLELLAERLPAGAEPGERARILLEAASVREVRLGDLRGALSAAEAGLRAAPGSREAREVCERLAGAVGAFAELYALLDEAASRLEGHGAEERALRMAAARVAEERLSDLDGASVQLRRCLALSPGDPAVLSSLTRLAVASERPQEARELLLLRARGASGGERAGLLDELAAVQEDPFADPPRAAEVYREAAGLAGSGRSARLLTRLAAALGASGDGAGEARALEEAVSAAGDPAATAAAARRLAHLRAGALSDPAAAIAHFRAALKVSAGDEDARSALERLAGAPDPAVSRAASGALLAAAESAGEPRRVLAALEVVASRAADPGSRAAAERRAARVWGESLGQWSMALAALHRAVRATPGDVELRAELRGAAERARCDAEAAAAYDALLPALRPEEAVVAWRELAALQEERLADAAGAERAWGEVLRLAPGDGEALRALRRLHRAGGRERELAEACMQLARAPAHQDEAERLGALREAARLFEAPLGQGARAVEAWEGVLAAEPGDAEAQGALERLLSGLDRPAELAALLERRRAQGSAGAEPDVGVRLAGLRRRMGAPAEALSTLVEVLREHPGHAAAREALLDLASAPGPVGREALSTADALLRGAGEGAARVALRERRLAAVSDPRERARLHAEIRATHERDGGDLRLAFEAAARAFAEGGPAREEAEADLVRLAGAAGLQEELALVHEAAAASAAGEEALELWRRAARVRTERGGEDGGGAAGAIAAWRRVLEEVPEDREALEALERLYGDAREATQLAEVARRRAALSQGPERAAQLVRLAGLQASLGEGAAALATAEDALREDPRSAEALALLARAHREGGRGADLARVLRAQADLARDDAPRRLGLLAERAALLEAIDPRDALDAYAEVLAESRQERRAVDGLGRLLAVPSTRDGAARILEDVLRSQGDARGLAALLEARLETADAAERAPLLAEVAVLRERLGQRAEAFAARERALREVVPPGEDDPTLRAHLERLAAATGDFAGLAVAYEAALERGLPPGPAADVRRRLASLYAERLSRPDLAARALEALAGEADGGEALRALARLHRASGAHRELASVLRRQAERATNAAEKKDLLFEVATIMEEHLTDREGAMDAYRQILSVDPEDPNALRLLGKLLGGAERWDELVEVLGREVEVLEGRPNLAAEAAELRFRLGRIRQQRLGDVSGALASYRGVLERVPRHPAALSALEELALGGSAGADEAAALLEPVYEQEGEHAKRVKTLEARAASAPVPATRAALLRRAAEIQAGPLRSPEVAFLTAAAALREDPDAAEGIALAARLAEGAHLHDELASLLAEIADRARDPRARLELRRRVAHLAARGGDPAATGQAWGKLLELAPDDPEALAGLTAAHRSSGDVEALAQNLRRRAAVEEDPGARAELLAELSAVEDEGLRDPAAAVVTLHRLLELAPGRRDALARLDRLCVATERWVELADVLAREATAAVGAKDIAAATAFRQRLAELKETRLLDREGALALYEEILAARPEDPQALSRIEGLLQRDPAHARAASVLERAYAATGAWAKYAAVLELRAGERPDPVERKALFLELADVREKRLGNRELAFVALCRAFRDDPADGALRGELARLARANGNAEELAGVLEEEFDRLPPAPAVDVALMLGGLHENELSAPEDAIRWLERARTLDAAGAPRALPGLDRLYRATGRHAELAEVLGAEAGLAPPAERGAFLFRLGQLCEEALQDPARAARAYEALLEVEPRQPAALRALERIYDGAERHADLAENLAAQRSLATDPPTRQRLTARLASVTQALGKDEEAVTLWKETLAQDPRHEGALAALEALYERLGRWPELAEALRGKLSITVDRREVARLHEKLGGLLGTRLGQPAEAVRSYLAVLDADPRNRGALEALRDLHAASGDLEGLASVYRRLVPLQENAAGVKGIRLQLAEVLLRAGKRGEAAEQGRRALELEPHGEAELARMGAIFEAAGAAAERVKAIEARAALLGAAGRTEEAVDGWAAAAEAWERGLGKAELAAAALEKVLELAPARRDAWVRLKEIYARSGNWRSYVRVSDLFTAQLTEQGERTAVLKEVAEIHEKRLGQKDMAFITLCRAFGEDPGDPALGASAERLAGETQAYDELAAVYEQVAEETSGLPRAKLLLALGRVRDARLDDPDGAEAAFRRALEADPASPDALDALTALFTRRGRVRDLVIALEQKLEAAAGLEEKKATLLEMARIYDGQLHDPEEAVTALRRVLELDGADEVALQSLAALYRREGRFADLAGILARARDLAPDDASRIDCQIQIAGLMENELSDEEAAVEAYRAVLGLDDGKREALAGLERLYSKLDRFAELNRVYEKQAEIATDPREQVRILGKSASIWEEKLGNPEKAIERNEAVLRLDPGNLAAARSLEALYRREEAWEKLIAVLQHHATLTQDRRELVGLQVQVGEVWWKELDRIDRAEAMFSHALEVEPDARAAISSLARLYEESGNWNLALEMLGREARLAVGEEAVELQSRIGRIQREELGDEAAARLAYARALDVDPGHLPSLRALRGLAEASRDREAYLRQLLAEARYTKDDAERAKLLHEAGRIHQEERDDTDGAARLYEEALRRVPDFLPAARPLADLYIARADWKRAEAVLDVIVDRLTKDGEAKELCRQSYRLGYVAEKLGNRAKALQSYRQSYELDATYLPVLEGLGNLLVHEEAWEEALRIFQAILIHHRDGLTDLEVVETYWQIGSLQVRLGQGERAAKSFEKALEIDSGHEPSRQSLVEVLEGEGDFEGAIEHRQKLVSSLDGPRKVEAYLAIGAICRDRLGDPYQAIDAFSAASRLDPGNLVATEALLGLYRDTRQGQKAADVLGRLLQAPGVQADPQRAARLHHNLGLTLRDELSDELGAAQELERALDADPRLVQAFADLEALLTQAKRWPELEGAYVRMIGRLPKTPETAPARKALWKTLAELYRRVLGDPEKARMAYQVVARSDPDDAAAVEAHADLAAGLPGHEEEAAAAYRQALRAGTPPEKPLSALVKLHAGRKAYDDAYSAAQTLAFLVGGASADEAQVVSRLRRFARENATAALDDGLWVGSLLHERARGPLAAVMSLLAREAGGVFAQTPKDFELVPKRDEVDVAGSMLFFVNMYKYAARALGFAAPRLFRTGEASARLQLVPLQPPAVVAGEELFQDRPKKELWFHLGKALAFLRPELTLARLMPHDQLDEVFQAAVSLGTSRFTVTADPQRVERLKRRMEKELPEETRTQTLKKLARAYCDVQRPGDVRAFMDAAELTSNRVGALLTADLEVVRKLVVGGKAAVSKLKDETRLRDLVLFCTSEEYASLRQHLGLSVVVPNG